MSVIFLHIGSHKTGTSALQSAFAVNSGRLQHQGVVYPASTGAADARLGRITSGNGLRLASYLNPQLPFGFRPEKFLSHFDRVITVANRKNILYSSEFLEAFDAERLKEFAAHAAAHGYQCKTVYFVRSIAGHAISSYSQAVKREKVTSSFAEYLGNSYRNPFKGTIQRSDAAIGRDSILVLNYDAVRKNLLRTFLRQVCDIDSREFRQPATVNRSLTATEIEVMRTVNARLESRRQATLVSDALIYADPEAATNFVITADEMLILRDLHAADLSFVNSRINGEQIVLRHASIKQGKRPELNQDELEKAAVRALALLPASPPRTADDNK